MYPIVCKYHTSHCHECMVCVAFDTAVKAHISNYTTPPQFHPAVVKLKTQEWMGSIFPVPATQ